MSDSVNENRPMVNARTRRSFWAELLARPVVWVILAGVFLAGDYAAGPSLQFPIAFAFPVALAAWHRVCAWCKRIRDEHDLWQPLDAYLSTRAELSLTHGICPGCMRKVVQDTAPGRV